MNKKRNKTESEIINAKYLGSEPSFTKPLSKVDYINALNWYNYIATVDDAREYLAEFLMERKRPSDAKIVRGIPDTFVPTTLGWIARMYSKGYILPVDADAYMHERLRAILVAFSKEQPVEQVEDEAPKVSVQDRMRERSRDILGEVEGIIDDHMESGSFEFYSWLQSNNIPAIYVGRIVAKLTPVLEEMIEALKTTDEQLKEGYKHLSKPQMKKIISFYQGLISDAERYSDTTKKTRAPRKPRAVSVEKKLKNLKFQKEDTTFKIASVNPEKIIGASELWTFNTKYKTLTVLKAKDRGGLQIKGTSVVNFDEVASKTKGTGRRTESYLSRAKEGGKIVLRKLMEELKTDKPLAYRINENTILLRTIN